MKFADSTVILPNAFRISNRLEMKKPSPADFGLTNGQIDVVAGKIKKFTQGAARTFFVCAFALIVIAMWKALGVFSIVVEWIPSFFAWAIGNFIADRLAILWYRAYSRYRVAMMKYEQWFMRTQKEYWLQMNWRRFEIEVAALMKQMGCDAIPS